MARRSIFVRLAVGLLAAVVLLGIAGAVAAPGSAAPAGPEVAVASPTQAENDLGDAPDSSNTSGFPMTAYPPGGLSGLPALFPTVYQAGSPPYGPIHWRPYGVAWLGPAYTLENEADVGPDQDLVNNILPFANKPDLDGADDGLRLPLRLPHCVPTTIAYIVNVVTPPITPLYINVWFDWWRDGEWDDIAQCGQTLAPEWAVQNQVLPAGMPAGLHVLTSPAFLPFHPLSSLDPNLVWMRISLSEQRWSGGGGTIGYGGSGPRGGYEFGETEDYYVENYLSALDWGDAPDGVLVPGYPTLLPNNGARHFIVPGGPFMGGAVDPDPDGQPTTAADGDDTDIDGDDEDGVIFAGPLRWGDPNAKALVDMTGSSVPCKINAWIDFNADYDWSDAGEQIITDGNGAAGVINSFSFAIPGTQPFPAGPTYARFRCSSQGGLGPAGGAPDGEVEDYQVRIKEPLDWGDAPDRPYPTLAANNGASHILTPNGPVLGALVDAEPDGQPNGSATGDDNSNLADEDGVLFATPLLPGQQACVNVTLGGAPGMLFAWIDFDHSGAWGDGLAEQILAGVPVVPGPNAGLCFPVPLTAQPGATFARFRLTSPIAVPLSPVGPAPNGEVEDYQVTVEAFKWNQPPVLNPNSQYPQCYWGWDEPSIYDGEQIVADDWACTDRRPVTDIHWWGSYKKWDKAEAPPSPVGPDKFHIGIWTDVPAGVDQQWSHPGEMIHHWIVAREALEERSVGCDFYPPQMQTPDTCFLYTYRIPQEEWFYQDPEKDQIYWISISAIYSQPPQQYVWGWKTQPRSAIDAAIRIMSPTAPQPGDSFVDGKPILDDFGKPWDMAFVLTTPSYDYGDAPDPTYPTLLASDGARHIYWPNGPFMGASVDTEPDGQPGPLAQRDDNNATDDEDGVTIRGPWVINQATNYNVVDTRLSPVACNLNAWVDFNANGSWLDAGEQVATDVPLSAGSIYGLGFTVPAFPTAVPGITYARFRCSSQTGLGPAGEALDGEVEDYRVELLAPPKPPVVTASIVNTTTLRLSWPKVTSDIYGNARLADGYRIYWNSSPYWTPAPGTQWASQWEPGLLDPVTQVAAHLGDPSMHHFYIVRAVYRDIDLNELESADSKRTGEFEFSLVPGSP